MESSHSSDTIDISRAVIRIFRLLTENFLIILITLVLCIAAGVIYFVTTPRTFESKMIIQSDILSESYALKLAENLNAHIRDGDVDFLANKLALTSEEADQLREFKIASALTPMSQQMPERDKIIIIISVRVVNNKLLPKLQASIIQYLSNNDYIKKRVEENRKKYQGLVAAMDHELRMLDSLKRKIIDGSFGSAKAGISILDVSGLYENTSEMYKDKYDFMIKLATVDSIQVIEDFTPYDKPVWPKLSITLLASLIVAFIIIFTLITFKSLRGQIKSSAS